MDWIYRGILGVLVKKSLNMLGSKTLGTNVLELQFVYVGKPWSKHLV